MIFQAYINPVMILIDVLFQTLFIYFPYYLIYRYVGRKSKTEKNEFSRSATITCVILMIILYIIQLIFDILPEIPFIQYFNKHHFLLGIGISLFIPFYTLMRKTITPEKTINEEFKKLTYILMELYWILSLCFLITDIFFTSLYNSIIIHLEFLWGGGILVVLFILTDLVNNMRDIETRLPKHILDKAKIYAGFISYFAWSFQLFIFGVFFRDFLNSGAIEEDIRIQIACMIVVFVGSFILLLNLKFLPDEAKRIENDIKQLKFRSEKDLRKDIDTEKEEIVISVEGLKTYFYTEEGIVRALEDVSFEVYKGEVLGLVGETGCGKSVTALSLQKLIPHPGVIEGGSVYYNGEDLLKKSEKEILNYRGRDIAMIFQDPLNSLNPVFKVGDQISEVYLLHMRDEMLKVTNVNTPKIIEKNDKIQKLHQKLNSFKKNKKQPSSDGEIERFQNPEDIISEIENTTFELSQLKKFSSIYSVAKQWGIKLLEDLNIPNPEVIFDQYPHALSGGMRQRIQIAMALACSPKLMIADEPTTALDVTVQNQILKLMQNLLRDYDTTILFITHDLGIISRLCDRVAVMYSGYIVEYGIRSILFKTPYHPYTSALLESIPKDGDEQQELNVIQGSVPNLIYPPPGCRFHPRCQFKFKPCDIHVPNRIEVEPRYYVACHLYDPQYKDLIDNENFKTNKRI